MEDVILSCLRLDRSYVVDQIIQDYVLHRECLKRGLVVSDAEIDEQVEELRTNLAPTTTLEATLKEHHATMDDVRISFRHKIEEIKFVAGGVKSCKLLHCEQIVIGFGSGNGSGSNARARTKQEAFALANDLCNRLKRGQEFGDLAARYSEGSEPGDKSDMGILYENMLGMEEAGVLKAAMDLKKGEVSPPIEAGHGYHILYALSSGEDHSPAENALYAKADDESQKLQLRFLGPTAVVKLIDESTITHVPDSDLMPGKPLPEAAAVVDGHTVRLRDVLAKALPASGRKRLDILIQNYVVDRECERRGVVVNDAEIDARIAALRKQIAPLTLEEGLTQHHTTMEGLRHDFKQEIQRTKLVIGDVPPTKSAHARIIFIRTDSTDSSESNSLPTHTDGDAKKLIADIQRQLKERKSFSDLAKQYSEMSHEGDLGILYEGKRDVDTAIVRNALALKKDEITSEPIKTYGGYFLLQVLNTGDSHAPEEDRGYDQAMSTYRQERAQSMVPHAILDLIKNSKVTYYLQS